MSEINECRKRLAESIAKECKCKNIVSHNWAVGGRKIELDKLLDLALKELCWIYSEDQKELMPEELQAEIRRRKLNKKSKEKSNVQE